MAEDEMKETSELNGLKSLDELFQELEAKLQDDQKPENVTENTPLQPERSGEATAAEEKPAPSPRRQKREEQEKKLTWQDTVMLYLHDVIYLLAVLMIAFILLFRIVVVSGSSMYSTLWDGDYLLVLSSVFSGEPEQGDIIVASKDSFNDGEPIIKRVIATEGQTVDIDFEAGVVYVDSVALEEEYTFTPTTVDEGMEYPVTVEEGCVFAMGDNRNRSRDSRYPDIGLIDEREILGQAVYLFFPGTGEGEYSGPRDFSRIGVLN